MSAELLLRLERQPCNQNVAFRSTSEAKRAPTGTIELRQDVDTGIVCNVSFDPERVAYGPSYQNEQGLSEVFVRHLSFVVDRLKNLLTGRRVVEIGCGKGKFLKLLQQRGVEVVGFDPAFEGVDPDIYKTTYSRKAAGARDAVILRHVLEHLQNPVDFLNTLNHDLGEPALVYIEVPCLDWILKNRAWFDVFYEHVNYFREADFYRIFGSVHESGRIFGDQYLYVIADLASIRKPLRATKITFPPDFFGGRERAIQSVESMQRFGIWGAGAKGTVFACQLADMGLSAHCAIDINPAKQGLFMPLSAVPIVGPEDAEHLLPEGGTVFVMNSNYLSEIENQCGRRYLCRAIDKV